MAKRRRKTTTSKKQTGRGVRRVRKGLQVPAAPTDDTTAEEERALLLTACLFSLVVAAVWPLIYPGLDYLLAVMHFGQEPGFWKFLEEFGPLFGRHASAPGVFKGMAQASEQLGGEHPALAGLSYMTKAGLLASTVYPLYVVEVVLFVLAGVAALASRFFGKAMRPVLETIAVGVAVLPLVATTLWWIAFIVLAYVQALSAGFLTFLFQLVLFPFVLTRVTSASLGVFLLALWFVPMALRCAGRDGFARRVPIALLPG
jgi:hypothetical protein